MLHLLCDSFDVIVVNVFVVAILSLVSCCGRVAACADWSVVILVLGLSVTFGEGAGMLLGTVSTTLIRMHPSGP